MSVIECKDLTFDRKERAVLKGIGFTAESGELIGLIGHNGAGKSTLIKLILGLIKPKSGSLSVLGSAPGARPLEVGYLPENVSFYNAMTVAEHLKYFSRLKNVPAERGEQLSAQLGLTPVMNQRLADCSKGQRQRLGLAQALLSSPKLLLLDEPTVGLDPDASAFMYRELTRLRDEGCTVVVCTHELTLIEPYLDRAVVMSGGELKGFGSMEALRAQCGLSVEISFAEDKDVGTVKSDERLGRYYESNRLLVPENRTEEVIRILTQELGIFNFRMKKADLRSVYDKLVHSTIREEN